MKRLVPVVAALLAMSVAACDSSSSAVCVTAMAPWVRLPAVPGRPGAGYFEIDAPAGQGDLLSVSSPQIGRIEMHESTSTNGVASMRRIEKMTANGCNRISTANGRHLMLFGIAPSVQPGARIELVFHFERGEPITVVPTVKAAGDEPHSEGH